MALSSSLFITVPFTYRSSPRSEGLSSVRFGPTHLNFQIRLGFSTVALARRRSAESGASERKKKPQPPPKGTEEEDDMDDAAFEALLKELENDLKNDPSFMNDDSEITEEDFAMVERVLAETLRGSSAYDIDLSSLSVDDVGSDEDDTETDDAKTDDNDAETDDGDDDDDVETDDEEEEGEEEED